MLLIFAPDNPLFNNVGIYVLMAVTMFLMLGFMFLMQWTRNQRRQDEREERRFQIEIERDKRETSKEDSGVSVVMNSAHDPALSSGTGSGGYIVVDMPENERPLFHDLLKGFEDYAKLKGYTIAFSIDATFDGRIAFKFTIKGGGVTVGPERVRKDFAEYVERLRSKDIDELEDLPVVTSIEEHNLLVTMLKNRIAFLKHSYQLSQNAIRYYEGLMANMRTFPALSAPSVVVHTGNMESQHYMDSRSYNATNSRNVAQGDSNMLMDNSIQIGNSFNERQERIEAVEDLIERLKAIEAKDRAVARIERELEKVRDELRDYPEPNESAIRKWLEFAKNAMTGSILGYEIMEAGRKLWELFGV
ncbi:MAG: hypothetical protein LAO78_27185 [Acidobacteriia bacterium]|nr:hypothetical protein [Terriglobia bacterium]